MLTNPEMFKKFLTNFLDLIETLLKKENLLSDEKVIAQLRISEETFNFFLDYFPAKKINEIFGMENWNALKRKRDELAAKIIKMIESDPKIKKRYENYCEGLKDLRKLSSFL
jgi:hypothetical protein